MPKKKRQVKNAARGGRSGSAKKRRKNADKKSILPGLPDDVFPLILSFCSVRDLLRVASSSKTLLNAVTYEHVFTSILCDGAGNARHTIETILGLLKKKQIFIPSPMRLLRLCNGLCCERCLWLKRMKKIRPDFGVFMCWRCEPLMGVYTKPKKYKAVKAKVEDKRTAMFYYGETRHFLWKKPYVTAGGERAGPIVTWEMIQSDDSVDSYFEQLGDLAPTDEEVQKLVDMFKPINKIAKKIAAREAIKKAQKLETYRTTKKARRERIIKQIEDMLDVPWNEFALQRREESSYRDQPKIIFKQHVARELLDPFMEAPSKGTKTKIEAIADQINTSYRTLYSKGIPTLSFLDTTHPFDSSLKAYLHRVRPTVPDMIREITVSELSSKNLLSFCHLNGGWDYARVILQAAGIIDDDEYRDNENSRYALLAERLWIESEDGHVRMHHDDPPTLEHQYDRLTLEEARPRFSMVLKLFQQLKPKLKEYWDRPETNEFIGDIDEAAVWEEREQVRDRKELVHEQLWGPKDAQKVQKLLVSSNYAALQKYHQRVYQKKDFERWPVW